MQHLGTKWFYISDFGWRRWSGAPPLDWLPAKAEGARSAHWWLRMHWPLTSFSPPAEAVYRGVATVIPNSFLGARSESWVLGEDQCPRPSQGMLLWGLQRYYLSPDTPYTPDVLINMLRNLKHSNPLSCVNISFIFILCRFKNYVKPPLLLVTRREKEEMERMEKAREEMLKERAEEGEKESDEDIEAEVKRKNKKKKGDDSGVSWVLLAGKGVLY